MISSLMSLREYFPRILKYILGRQRGDAVDRLHKMEILETAEVVEVQTAFQI